MNTNLDPIIVKKLDDFRSRRRNLILLRGLCSGILSFLGTFVLIALIDYLTRGRMSEDLRSGLSILGYCLVLILFWKTCLGPLLLLPSAKKLARLLEQSSPDLKEDLLSAVELGMGNQSSSDSDVFRKLLQKQASTKVSELDIKNILPLGTLKYWLRGTAGLIAITFALLQIPDFGSALKLLMQRAIFPGSNLPPVSFYEVRILAPDEKVTRTPGNEPLRFLISIKTKKEGRAFKEISLETRTIHESKDVTLVSRNPERFFVDYNVGNEKFEYRILVDQAPQTEWRKMDVGVRPFIENFKKTFEFPEYSELEPLEITEKHGDLETWEGTTVDLSLMANQPLKSGKLEFKWLEKPEELRDLKPEVDKHVLRTSILMSHPGTYRIKNLIDEEFGWEGRPSSTFEITVKPDLAPSIQWVEPIERKLLVAPNDLLSFSALAQDDLGLARIEYLIQKNQGIWESFLIPGLLDPRGKNSLALSFDLDLLMHKLKPVSQALLKLRAKDLKGTETETETIELSVVSRDFDLSSLILLEKKAQVLKHYDIMREQSVQMQRNFQRSSKDFQQNKGGKNILIEKVNQAEGEFITTAEDAYENLLRSLVSMPRGADSFQLSILTQAAGQIFKTLGTTWEELIEDAEKSTEINQVRSKINELNRRVLSRRMSMSGNVRNIAEDLLNQHAEVVAVSYLRALLNRQKELIKDAERRKALPFLVRRQEVALSQWKPVSKALLYSRDSLRSSALKRIKSEQLKLQQDLLGIKGDRKKLKKQISDWEKNLQNIHRETAQKLASKSRESFRHKAEELFWNLNRNHLYWDELHRGWQKVVQSKPDTLDLAISKVRSEIEIIIVETLMLSEVEQARKDQNALFVKDAGQTGRALIEMQQNIRAEENISDLSDKSSKIGSSFDLLLLQHHLIGSANQLLYFMSKERSQPVTWSGAECARQWGRVEAIWKPILDSMYRMRLSYEVIEIMKKLPNQPYRKNIIGEMQNRLKFDQRETKLMVEDADFVFQDLQKIISLLKDDFRKARVFINQNAPTIAELARELAKETEKQKAKIEKIHQDQNQTLANKREELYQLNQVQEKISDSIENFAQALRQEANIQNLLDEQGREIARDADDAAALVEETESEIAEKLKEATQGQNSEEIEISTRQTSEKQEELIEELNLIAEHFEKLENQESVTETRVELRDLEETLEISKEIEEQYAQAERLADLAQLSPEDLLQELEEELDQNQAMQRELSELAEEIVQKAKDQVEEALRSEEDFIDKLEKEDKDIQKQKQELVKKLEQLAKETQKFAAQKIDPLQEQVDKALAETASEMAEDLMEALEETGQTVEDLAKKKPHTQELKVAALQLAESLHHADEELRDLSDDLRKQAVVTPEESLKKAEQTKKIAQKRQAESESLQQEANQKNEEAQQAQQKSLLEKRKADEIQDKLSEAAKKLAKAEEKATQVRDDPKVQKNLEETKNEVAKLSDTSGVLKQALTEAQKEAEELQEEAKLAQAVANSASEQAQEAVAQAEEAQLLAEAMAENSQREEIKQANEKGSELADEAAQVAGDLLQQAEELAHALDQLTESAVGNQDLLTKAEEAQQQIAEDLFETSQELSRAARHEERLENQPADELLGHLADSTEEIALDQIPETAQALENQALRNELQDLAELAEDLAKDLSQSQPAGDEQVAEDLTKSAAEIKNMMEGEPSFAELQQQAQTFSEKVKQAEKELNKLAETVTAESESAREKAENSADSARKAKAERTEALKKAKQAEQLTESLGKAAAEAAKKMEAGNLSPQEAEEAAAAAQSASEDAQQLASLAETAQENFKTAQKQAGVDQQVAERSMEESVQASKQAGSAADLAVAAEQLLEEISAPLLKELWDANLPVAAKALNEASDTLEDQIEALENLHSGESSIPEFQSAKNSSAVDSSVEQGSIDLSILSADETDFSENAFSSVSPFSNPEVNEALAQTLDSLDKAIFGNDNPFTEPIDAPSEPPSSQESAKGEPSVDEAPVYQPIGNPNETSSEPVPGNGPGNGGSGAEATLASPDMAMDFALQSLRLATQSYAQAMVQQRTKIIMADARGNQMNSADGEYLVTPFADVGDLPNLEEIVDEDDWGKLPPQLSKDLLEARHERVSENYRSQVQAYFQAISNKARTLKK